MGRSGTLVFCILFDLMTKLTWIGDFDFVTCMKTRERERSGNGKQSKLNESDKETVNKGCMW